MNPLRSKGKRTIAYSTLLIILLVTSIITIPYIYRWWQSSASGFIIQSTSFQLRPDGRYSLISIKSTGSQPIEIVSIQFNNTKVPAFEATINPVQPGQTAMLTVQYPWQSKSNYYIRIDTKQGSSSQIQAQTPKISPDAKVTKTGITQQQIGGSYRISLSYRINTTSYDWTYLALFIYQSYKQQRLPIYVFYDSIYMPEETLNRALTFANLAKEYGFNASLLNWNSLAGLTRFKPSCILLLFNPLMNSTGTRLFDAAPSLLLDPNENGLVKDHSTSNRSLVYDWENENGLVFVSIGSDKAPASQILAKNGTSYATRDIAYTDALFAATPGAFRGLGYNSITPTNIGKTLGLNNWGGWWQLDLSILDSSIGPRSYCAYGLVGNTGWSQPCYINNGKGGWLYMGNGWNLDNTEAANDILMIILNAPWNSVPLDDKSWSYDSGFNIYPTSGGSLNRTDSLNTGLYDTLSISTIVARLLIISYNADKNQYFTQENIFTYEEK